VTGLDGVPGRLPRSKSERGQDRQVAAARCAGDDRDRAGRGRERARARAATAGSATARGLIPGAQAVAGSISVEIYAHLSRGTLPVCADSVAAIRLEAIEQRRGLLAEPAGSTERAGRVLAAH